MLYGFLNNLVPSKPFQVPYILLSTSMPKVALEKFGFPEVDLDSKSKKIVFVMNRNGKVIWLHALKGEVRYALARPLSDGKIGVLTSGKKSQFYKIDKNYFVNFRITSDEIYPRSEWGRDFIESRERIIFLGLVQQYYREKFNFFDEPRPIVNGRIFEMNILKRGAREIWNPNSMYAPDYSKSQNKYNEVISLDQTSDSLVVLLSKSNKILFIDKVNHSKIRELELVLNAGEYVNHFSTKNNKLVTLTSSGRVILWDLDGNNAYEKWVYTLSKITGESKRGSVAITEQNTILALLSSRNIKSDSKNEEVETLGRLERRVAAI